MRIAIQKGMDELREKLIKSGHEVFLIGENQVADAILYKEADTYPYYEVNNIPSAVSSSVGGHAAYGALLVNVTNKSFEEINHILTKRTYSPLF